jgi:hypothetical protein
MQQWLIKARLIFLCHEKHLIVRSVEFFRQFGLFDPLIHRDFGPGLAVGIGVFDRAGKSHQCSDIFVAFFLNVFVEILFVAHRVQSGISHDHRFSAAANLVFHMRAKVFDHNLGLGGQIMRV